MGNLVAAKEFSVQETHGILLREENEIFSTSTGLGWPTLYASAQLENPYEDKFSAVDDHLIILHLDGPVPVTRGLGKSQTRRMIAPGGLFILPGGLDFSVRLEGVLNSFHVYLRKQIVEEVAADFGYDCGTDILPSMGDHDPLIERLALGLQGQ